MRVTVDLQNVYVTVAVGQSGFSDIGWESCVFDTSEIWLVQGAYPRIVLCLRNS